MISDSEQNQIKPNPNKEIKIRTYLVRLLKIPVTQPARNNKRRQVRVDDDGKGLVHW